MLYLQMTGLHASHFVKIPFLVPIIRIIPLDDCNNDPPPQCFPFCAEKIIVDSTLESSLKSISQFSSM